MAEKIDTSFVINTPEGLLKDNDRGCTERIKRLRRISHSTQPHLDLERAKIETDVYKEYEGSVSVPVLRALVLKEYFSRKTLYLGDDELRLIDSASYTEYLAQKVEDTNGCYVFPAFTGLGAPYWDQYARGTIVGLTRGVNKDHIIRATLESLAYQVNDVLEAMGADSGIALSALKVDGGASANNFLMQTQADISRAPVHRPKCVETTAMGAAYLAGLAVGYWKDKEDVKQNWDIDRVFQPDIEIEKQQKMLKGWKKAVQYAHGWAKEELS